VSNLVCLKSQDFNVYLCAIMLEHMKKKSYLYWHKYKRVFNYKLQIKGECSYRKLKWWIVFCTKYFVVQKGSCCFFPNIDLFWIVYHENIVHSFHIRYILMWLSIDWCFKEVKLPSSASKLNDWNILSISLGSSELLGNNAFAYSSYNTPTNTTPLNTL
jgi:hypothetical protein